MVFEPALGALYEGLYPQIQRITGVNGKERANKQKAYMLIRVVPPSLSVPFGMKGFFVD